MTEYLSMWALRQMDVFASLAGGLGSALRARSTAEKDLWYPVAHIYGNAGSYEYIRAVHSGFGDSFFIERGGQNALSNASNSQLNSAVLKILERAGIVSPSLQQALRGNQLKLRATAFPALIGEVISGETQIISNLANPGNITHALPAILARAAWELSALHYRDGWVYLHAEGVLFAHKLGKKYQPSTATLRKLGGGSDVFIS